MKSKIIFWDWTGTLADESALDKAVCRTLEEDLAKKEGISFEEAASRYGEFLKTLENTWQWHDYVMHCERFGIDWRHSQEVNLHLLKPMDGAGEILEYTHSRGYKNILATNAVSRVIRLRLEYAGLGDLLDDVIGSDFASALKAEGRHYRLGLDKFDGDSRLSFAVGDNPIQDILPARELGMGTVYCIYGKNLTHYHSAHISHNHNVSADADHSIRSLADMKSIIQEVS